MTGEPTVNEVYVQAVKDHLDGTPNAHHPVQFEQMDNARLDACTLCGALVPATDEWRDKHRGNHDLHNRVHAAIERHSHPEKRYR